MKVIILPINLYDYKSELKVKDLVCIDDVYYNIEKIDTKYNVKPGEPDNIYKYFIRSKINNELMNFARNELSKCNIAYFDYNTYVQSGIKKYVAQVPFNDPNFISDINHIKGKFAYEWDMGKSEFDFIHTQDFINLDFEGDYIEKEIQHHPDQPSIKINQFKIKSYENI
jgi:hypothetical protein